MYATSLTIATSVTRWDSRSTRSFRTVVRKPTSFGLHEGAVASTGVLVSPDSPSTTLIELEAANEGTWGDDLRVRITSKEPNSSPPSDLLTLEVGYLTGAAGQQRFEASESFTDLDLDPNSSNYIVHQVQSDLINVTGAAAGVPAADVLAAVAALPAADDGSQLIELAGGGNGSDPATR